MSAKFLTKGRREKGNANVQPILHHHKIVQKPLIIQNIPKPSPILFDRSEFPSLNESSGKVSNNNSTGKTLKYSDKLKLQPFSENQYAMAVDFSTKCDTVITNAHNQTDVRTSKKGTCINSLTKRDTIITNAHNQADVGTGKKETCINSGDKSFNKEVNQNFSQNNSDKPTLECKYKVISSNKKVPEKELNKSSNNINSLNQQLIHGNRNELSKQKHLKNSVNSKCGTSKTNFANINLNTKSNSQLNSSGKSCVKTSELKEDERHAVQSKDTKKKKRKSKVKRQVALQSGKITFLSPEVHSKILNQTSALTSQSSKSVLTDINDEEEYPELGKPLLPDSQKKNVSKKDMSAKTLKKNAVKPPDTFSEDDLLVTNHIKESPVCGSTSDEPSVDKKEKSDSKVTVHPKDPITISFYDILVNKNTKPKERDMKNETFIPNNIGLTKIKTKKDACQPHNLLDSSSPMVKRGKERENPKPKKPSQLKKIILLDRKTRREHLFHFKNNNPVEDYAIGNEFAEKVNVEDIDNETSAIEIAESNSFNISVNERIKVADETPKQMLEDFYVSTSQQEDADDQTSLTPFNNENIQDELASKIKQLNLSETYEHGKVIDEFSFTATTDEDIETTDILENSVLSLSLDKMCKNAEDGKVMSSVVAKSVSSVEKPITVIPHSPDSLLNSLINLKKTKNADREKAAKVLIHSRHFREYCDHLVNKDINDAVFSLLDDLARFQDRLHAKDPVKAHIKRRMINGFKEVKKYIKLRKLKCIIIAVDIENVETQGGLNDVLNDIKLSAAEHHVPYIFALSRKVLGRVTRKPVPVSCVGVLNYEGSEINFKKIIELQTKNKVDYNEIFSKLTLKLTDEEASHLLKTKTEAPETFYYIRTDMLKDFKDFFKKSKIDTAKNKKPRKSYDQIEFIDAKA